MAALFAKKSGLVIQWRLPWSSFGPTSASTLGAAVRPDNPLSTVDWGPAGKRETESCRT